MRLLIILLLFFIVVTNVKSQDNKEYLILIAFIKTESNFKYLKKYGEIVMCFSKGAKNDWGILQITPIMVKEYNNITGEKLKHSDCFYVKKSIKIFLTVQRIHNPDFNIKKAANFWNCGSISKHNSKYYKNILSNLK